MPDHEEKQQKQIVEITGRVIETTGRVIALETTMSHLSTSVMQYAERENTHYHALRTENKDQEGRIRMLEERQDVRFQKLEAKIAMAIGGLAVFQFIIGVALTLLHMFKK